MRNVKLFIRTARGRFAELTDWDKELKYKGNIVFCMADAFPPPTYVIKAKGLKMTDIFVTKEHFPFLEIGDMHTRWAALPTADIKWDIYSSLTCEASNAIQTASVTVRFTGIFLFSSFLT